MLNRFQAFLDNIPAHIVALIDLAHATLCCTSVWVEHCASQSPLCTISEFVTFCLDIKPRNWKQGPTDDT